MAIGSSYHRLFKLLVVLLVLDMSDIDPLIRKSAPYVCVHHPSAVCLVMNLVVLNPGLFRCTRPGFRGC